MSDKMKSINRHIGGRLKMLRAKLGLTQTDVGNILGVTYQQEQKYENGSGRLTAESLCLLAKGLRVDIGYFFEGLSLSEHRPGFSDERTEYVAEPGALSDAERLDKAFSRLRSRASRLQAIALVELVADNYGIGTSD